MHGEREVSQWPRRVGVAVHLLVLVFCGWLLLGEGLQVLGEPFPGRWQPGDSARRLTLFLFGVVLFGRLTYTALRLLKRRFDWMELAGVVFACFVYQVGFALLGGTNPVPLDGVDLCGIALFAAGSLLNTLSEMHRRRFKERPENSGRLYTGGLFRYARHINYTGDLLWVTGWALVTRNPWAAFVPLALLGGFVFFFIPDISKHLRRKYGSDYERWAARTKRLIPFVY